MKIDELLNHLKVAARDTDAEPWTEEHLFAYFQRFRPDGRGVETALSILPNPQRYIARLLPVFQATRHPRWENDMYFVVREPLPMTERQAVEAGKQFLANLISLFDDSDGGECLDYFKTVMDVTVVGNSINKARHSDEHALVYDSIGDMLGHGIDYEDAVHLLYEAWYSIACDADLTHYLQWPCYESTYSVDVFEPYFRLWERGYSYAFEGDKLLLSRG